MSEISNGGPAFPAEQGILQKGMTLRQYAAIKLRVPSSGTDWLDEMIRESLRDELAEMHMQALCSTAFYTDGNLMPHEVAKHSYEMADAMLAAREAKQ